jgi:hypothetical protein
MNEQSNNVLAEEFRFFMTWGKYRDKLGLSISEHEDVRLAVDKAYIDMSTRTIKGLSLEFKGNKDLKKACKTREWEERKNALIDDCKKHLTDLIVKLFTDSKDKDDTCQETTNKDIEINNIYTKDKAERKIAENLTFKYKLAIISKCFLDEYKSAMNELNQSISQVSNSDTYLIDVDNIKYGKAQKIVNMTCKYLMLFSDASDYQKVFQQCEMPLDSKILEYYNNTIVTSLNKSKNSKIQRCNTAWSNLEYDEYEDIQKNIKEFCESNKNTDLNLTGFPLIDEFTIWKNQINQINK